MDIKEQAINGVMWNSVGTLSSFAIDFIVGIILARILTPNEFGLIGTIMVVINISLVFVNSGLSQAIIRKQDCTQTDYSTAFFFNIFIGIFLFLVLFLTARPISLFFNNTALRPLIQVLGFGLIINSFTLVQNAKLTQRIDFRSLTRFTIIASVTSGVISVVMAFSGFGVWSLVAKTLTSQAAITFLLWYHNRWKPEIVFSMESFKSLFRFGSNLLLSGLIGTIFNNIYYAVIGKYFSAQDLGFYTRAELFKNIPSQTAQGIITSVSFPVLAKVKDNPAQLSSAFKKILTTTFFIVSLLMFGMAAVSESMVITLIGEQWRQSVTYLKMLCFVGLMLPLNSININLLNVVGRSDLYMKLQLISQILTVPVIIFGIIYGIKVMILGMSINSLLAFFYFGVVASKYSSYSVFKQLRDIFPDLLLAFFMGCIVYYFEIFTHFDSTLTLILQILIGTAIIFLAGEFFHVRDYRVIREIIVEKFRSHIKSS